MQKFALVYTNAEEFVRHLDWREITQDLRPLIVELAMDYGAHKTKSKRVFGLGSRQTIDNWIHSYQKYGLSGLINSSKNQDNKHRCKGNKAKQLEDDRAIEKSDTQAFFDDLKIQVFDR